MNHNVYQNLLSKSPKISDRLNNGLGSRSNKRFFRLWFIIFFVAFFGLYALGLAPAGVSEIGDSIVYDSGFVSSGIILTENILSNGANFVSSEIGSLAEAFSSAIIYAMSKPAYAINVLRANFSSFASSEKNETHKNELAVESTPVPVSALVSADFSDARIIIPAIAVDASIIFPDSADVDVLNNDLLKGVVHYPGSALPGEKGKIFLFGHSTGFAVVHNKSFKSFNRLKDLKTGDIVKIQTSSKEYRYRVLTMRIAEADNTMVNFDSKKQTLVLLTCKIFGQNAKDDRYMVEAEFMGNYPLPN